MSFENRGWCGSVKEPVTLQKLCMGAQRSVCGGLHGQRQLSGTTGREGCQQAGPTKPRTSHSSTGTSPRKRATVADKSRDVQETLSGSEGSREPHPVSSPYSSWIKVGMGWQRAPRDCPKDTQSSGAIMS